MNGAIRDREKMFRGLGNMDTPVFGGMKIRHNYVRRYDDIHQRPV